jgi:hypothetical protein
MTEYYKISGHGEHISDQMFDLQEHLQKRALSRATEGLPSLNKMQEEMYDPQKYQLLPSKPSCNIYHYLPGIQVVAHLLRSSLW